MAHNILLWAIPLLFLVILDEISGFKFNLKNFSKFQPKFESRSTIAIHTAKHLDEVSHNHIQPISILRVYDKMLNSHPLSTKILTSATVGALGDALLQISHFASHSKPLSIDKRRLIIFCVVSAIYIAPTIHFWFDWLNNIQFPSDLGKSSKALIMMLLDQTLGAFLVTFGFFYAFEIVSDSLGVFCLSLGINLSHATLDIRNNLSYTATSVVKRDRIRNKS